MNYEAFSRVPNTAGVWDKLNEVKTNKRLSELLRSYIDETTKITAISSLGAPSGAQATDKKQAEYTPFASGIWTFGHLATELSRHGVDVTKAQPTSTINHLLEWWKTDRADAAIKGHHVTASFDPRIAKEMNRLGYPIDAMLLATLHDTLTQYASRFYPGQSIGYVVGCHHDTENPHCHALVHPTTESGKLIRFSGNDFDKKEEQEDRFEFLRNTFNLRARQLFVSLSRDINPPDSIAAKLAYWLLLCRHSMLAVGPGSLDAASAAAALVASARGKMTLAKTIDESRQQIESECLTPPRGTPSPERIRARWTEIHDGWTAASTAHSQAAMDAFNATRAPAEAGDYSPVFSEHATPQPSGKTAYVALAGREMRAPPLDVWAAQEARRKWNSRQRAQVGDTMKAYRGSLDLSRAKLDALMANTGFAVAQFHVSAAATFGTRPSFLGALTGMDDTQSTRELPSGAWVENLAERGMVVAAEREAETHKPADPTAVPSIFAKVHAPRFRALKMPVPLTEDRLPIIGI